MLELIGAIDLDKYAGEWIEIARKPNFFQKQCEASKALYSDIQYQNNKPYQLKVTNSCKNRDGEISEAVGQAKVITDDYRGLAVSFTFWTDWMDSVNYQILYLDINYSQALVGSPNKKYLWILSRQPLTQTRIEELLKMANSYGYDTEDIIIHPTSTSSE